MGSQQVRFGQDNCGNELVKSLSERGFMKTLLELSSNDPDPTVSAPAWRREVVGRIFCPECIKIKRAIFPEPIDVVLYEPPGHKVMDSASVVCLDIYHRDFMAQIREHLSDYAFGRCLGQNGEVYDEYVTCYAPDYIVVRGNKDSDYYICPTCGSIQSHEWWHGPQYVLRAYLNESLIYQDCMTNMYLEEELACSLDLSPWPDVEFRPIGIRDEPMDGQQLPCDSQAGVKRRGASTQ